MGDKETNKVGGRIISSRLSTTKSITSAITALIVCVGLFVWLSSLNLRLVRGVTSAQPNAYPGITYEEAFSQFYSNPKWEDASTDSTKIVRFTGDCTYEGKKVKVVMNFWVDDKVFRLHDGTINGVSAGVLELNELHNRPFEVYKKK